MRVRVTRRKTGIILGSPLAQLNRIRCSCIDTKVYRGAMIAAIVSCGRLPFMILGDGKVAGDHGNNLVAPMFKRRPFAL